MGHAGQLGRTFSTIVTLRDGSAMRIRAIRPDDKARLAGHFARLSKRSIYRRFFRVKLVLTDAELKHFTELDFVDAVGLVATLGEGAQEEIVGVGRYYVDHEAPGAQRRAEVAFAVEDAHQGRGIATRLLEQLLSFARQGHIDTLEGDVLADNVHMLHVLSRMGFAVTSRQHGVVRLSVPVVGDSARKSA